MPNPWSSPARLVSWSIAATGVLALSAAVAADPADASSAARQVWAPFVLVAGLLIVGLVAAGDGLFAVVGHRLAMLAPGRAGLFGAATVTIAVVTALLNLDTSVVFLTPVLVHAARTRGREETSMLVACLLLANAGSLLLPGSNLTNLMVLGHLHLSGSDFLRRMALPWIAAVLVTALVVGVDGRRRVQSSRVDGAGTVGRVGTVGRPGEERERLTGWLGAASVFVVTVLILVLRSPAIPVLAVALLVATARLVQRRHGLPQVVDVLGLPFLVGLFGIAVALGTLGRAWTGPETLLAHLDAPGTAVLAALGSVLVNNLPAASLLAAHVPPHPFALLIGLNVGPNLFVTGSLAWILWWRTVRATGSHPPLTRAVVLGLLSTPLAMAGALAMLAVTGPL